jgi:hypothetical protein
MPLTDYSRILSQTMPIMADDGHANETMTPDRTDRAKKMLTDFSDKYVHLIQWANIREALNNDDDMMIESCGFDILLQVLYCSYGDMIRRMRNNEKDEDADDSCVEHVVSKDTLFGDLEGDRDEFEKSRIGRNVIVTETMNLIEPEKVERRTGKTKMVPETSAIFAAEEDYYDDGDDDEEVVPSSDKKKKTKKGLRAKLQSFDKGDADVVATLPHQDDIDVAIGRTKGQKKEDYDIQRHMTEKKKQSTSSCNTEKSESSESPSILKSSKRTDPTTKSETLNDEDDDDLDDFVTGGRKKKTETAPPVMGATARKSPRKPPQSFASSYPATVKKQRNSNVRVTNKYGIEVEETTHSQSQKMQNMRQGTLSQFVGASGGGKKRKDFGAAEAHGIKKAKVESIKTFQVEEEGRREKNNRSPLSESNARLDDSFDRLGSDPEDDDGAKKGFKFQGDAARSKEAKASLLGIDCPDCRNFYQNENMSTQQLEQVLQRCSKHRTAYTPSGRDSPKAPWDLEIAVNTQAEKTQVGSPLKTRERRRAVKK